MSEQTERMEQIVAARMKLRQRFLDRMQQSPSLADDVPMGSGELNRHGMPQLPPQQTDAADGKWPVLDLGFHPKIATGDWKLTLDGACHQPRTLGWDDLMALEQVDDVSDFHCVTKWSRLNLAWRGVRRMS